MLYALTWGTRKWVMHTKQNSDEITRMYCAVLQKSSLATPELSKRQENVFLKSLLESNINKDGFSLKEGATKYLKSIHKIN